MVGGTTTPGWSLDYAPYRFIAGPPMKWVITLSLILFAVAMPFQRALADNPQPPNFGPLASRIGEWLG